MPDPSLGALSTVVVDLENPGGWNSASKIQGINSCAVTTPGTGYANIFPVTFTGGTGSGGAAVAYATGGAIQNIVVTSAGAYTVVPTTVVLTAGGGSSGVATVTLGTSQAKQIGVVSETISPAQALLPNATLRGDFNALDPANGQISAQGQLVVIPNQQLAQFFLKSIVGGGLQTVVTGSGPYTHTNKVGNLLPLSFILETYMLVAGVPKYNRATGCRINQLTIPIADTGLCQWTMDVMAANVQVGNAAPYQAAAATDFRSLGVPMDHTQISAAATLIGGSAVTYIQKGSLTFNFGLDGKDYRVGGAATRGSLVPAAPVAISGSLDLVLDNTALLTLLTAGTASSLSLTWTMGAGSVQIALDRLFIQKNGPVIKNGGGVVVTCSVRGVYDSGNATSFRSVVINDQAGTVYN